ncbi:MAG: hypothetical protein ACLFVJ_20970 [Persicimonas sp.]
MKHIDDDSNYSISFTSPSFASFGVALVVAAIVVLWPQSASTLEDPCALDLSGQDASQQDVRGDSVRQKASRFAPTLRLRLWFRPDDRHEDRQQTIASAVVAAPEPADGYDQPDRSKFESDRPFGWQIQFQWDVIRMLQVAPPAGFEVAQRLESTRCRILRQRVGREIEELWYADDELGGPNDQR